MNRGWRYNQVAGTFWQDRKIRSLTGDGRTLAIYLLTCPDRAAEGFYGLPRVLALDHLCWTSERFLRVLTELASVDFAEYDEDGEVVFIVRALKYQPPTGPKSIRGALKALDDVHDAPRLFGRFLESADRYAPEFGTAIRARYGLPESATDVAKLAR